MTREEAKQIISDIDKAYRNFTADEYIALDMAIQALSQEPCDDTVSIRKDVLKCRVGKLVVYNVEWLKKHWQMEMDIVCGVKTCDDAISRQAVLSKKIYTETEEGWSGYTVDADYIEHLPSVTQKPIECDDAISRLDKIRQIIAIPNSVIQEDVLKYKMICEVMKDDLPSVTQKSGKWIKDECGNVICSECKSFRRDCRYGHTNYCNRCGARMFEPQESEEISDTNMKMWEELFKAESEE